MPSSVVSELETDTGHWGNDAVLWALILDLSSTIIQHRQEELQLSLQHKTSAAPGHFTCAGCHWHNYSDKGSYNPFISSSLSSPYSIMFNSKLIKQTDTENKLKQRFSVVLFKLYFISCYYILFLFWLQHHVILDSSFKEYNFKPFIS